MSKKAIKKVFKTFKKLCLQLFVLFFPHNWFLEDMFLVRERLLGSTLLQADNKDMKHLFSFSYFMKILFMSFRIVGGFYFTISQISFIRGETIPCYESSKTVTAIDIFLYMLFFFSCK